MLMLRPDVVLLPEQVRAIKVLVAASVPRMEPENVVVIDAASGLELSDYIEIPDTTVDAIAGTLTAIELERFYQEIIEENVRKVLVPIYGDENVSVAARVSLDIDRMMQERYELLPRRNLEGEDIGGFMTRYEEEGGIDGIRTVAGIVGEELNTDIPNYPLYGAPGNQDMVHWYRNIDYDYGYLMTQVERGAAIVRGSSVSVVVDEQRMTDARRRELVELVAQAAGVEAEYVAISTLLPPPPPPPEPEPDPPPPPPPDPPPNWWDRVPWWIYACACALMLLIALFIGIFVLIRRRVQRKSEEKVVVVQEQIIQEQMETVEEELQEMMESAQDEIERYKQELAKAAMETVDEKEEAITDEIRQFAKDNPEITANLLRTWLKEGES